MQQKFLRAVGWSFLSEAGSHSLSIIFIIVLARLLAPADFGIISAASVFLALAVQTSTWGIDKELLQREEADHAEFSTGFWLVSAFSIVLAGI